jgi:hypothetical protein
MVYLEGNSKAVFTHTMFSGSGHYGLWVPSGGDIAGFDQNTFVANAEDMVRVTFGNTDAVMTPQSWHDFDAAIVRNGGFLTCTNVDHGGFMYYVYTNAGGSAQPLCPF